MPSVSLVPFFLAECTAMNDVVLSYNFENIHTCIACNTVLVIIRMRVNMLPDIYSLLALNAVTAAFEHYSKR